MQKLFNQLYILSMNCFLSGVTGGSWGKDTDKNKGGYQDNSDDDDNNAHRGYSPDPGSEYKDTEGIIFLLFVLYENCEIIQ